MAENGEGVTQRQGAEHNTGDENTGVIALAQMQDQAEIESLRRELEEMRLQAEHCRQDARRADRDRLEAEASYRRTIEETEDQYRRESDASRQRVREMENLIQSEQDRLGTRFEHQVQVIGALKRRVRIAEQETASMKSWAEAGGHPQLSSRPDDIRQSDAGDVTQVPSAPRHTSWSIPIDHSLQTGYGAGGSQSPVVPQPYRPIQGQIQGHNIGFQVLPGPMMPVPPRYAVPLPNQMLFDGKYSWQSFIQPFQSTAMMCK